MRGTFYTILHNLFISLFIILIALTTKKNQPNAKLTFLFTAFYICIMFANVNNILYSTPQLSFTVKRLISFHPSYFDFCSII